jgi:flagellar biosynthesis chaperone FliJ
MKSQFRLASILRLRTLLEELEEKRLQLIHARLQDANNFLRHLHEDIEDAHKSFLDNHSELCGAELHFLNLCTMQARKAEDAARENIQKLTAARVQQQLRFEKAHQDLLVIEKLRDRQVKKSSQEKFRILQKELDETYSLTSFSSRHPLPPK